MAEDRLPQISIHHIPIEGSRGAALAIVVLLTMMFVELPPLRWPMLGSIAAGIPLGIGLIFWRRRFGRPATPGFQLRRQ
jgi:hypothetical protein